MVEDSIDRHIAYWRDEVPDLDDEVEGIVTRMQMLVRHLQQRRGEALEEHGLRAWEYEILWRLRAAGPPYRMTPTALAVALDTHPATLTNRLDRLTRAGLVERSRDETDRRSVVVVLTPAGSARLGVGDRFAGRRGAHAPVAAVGAGAADHDEAAPQGGAGRRSGRPGLMAVPRARG